VSIQPFDVNTCHLRLYLGNGNVVKGKKKREKELKGKKERGENEKKRKKR